jgi:DNA replication protein DnaC
VKKVNETLEQASIRQYCKTVRVPTIAVNFISLAEQAVKENQTHTRYLEALLAIECEERDRHAIANRIRDAQLPRMKSRLLPGPTSSGGQDPGTCRRRLHRPLRTSGAHR